MRDQNRPAEWKANPQALADLGRRTRDNYTGTPELRSHEADGDTWLTPRYILDHLGKFDLDPCAAESNPTWAAPNYFTKADDGLTIPWFGRVWCNPPFSDVRPWIIRHRNYFSGILLTTAGIESRIWREIVWPSAKAIYLLHGRTRFAKPDGSPTTGRPLRSIALIAWKDADAEILAAAPFAGVLLQSWKQK